jgi:hypothetical protein
MKSYDGLGSSEGSRILNCSGENQFLPNAIDDIVIVTQW